jgi:hypothetical protein
VAPIVDVAFLLLRAEPGSRAAKVALATRRLKVHLIAKEELETALLEEWVGRAVKVDREELAVMAAYSH